MKRRSEKRRILKKPQVKRFGAVSGLTQGRCDQTAPQQIVYDNL